MESSRPRSVRRRGADASRLRRLLPAACCLLPALLVTGGCNNGKQLQADLYQRELRLQEDEIYRLEDCIEQYQGIIRGYRCEVADLKRQMGDGVSVEPTPAGPEFQSGAAPERDVPDRGGPDHGGPEEDAPEFLPAPDASEAPEFTPGPPAEEAPPFDAGAAIAIDEEARLASLDRETPATPSLLKLGEVDTLRLDVRNGEPAEAGEPTLLAEVTPLSEGAPAYFEGEASVLLAEIPRDGPMRRVARWDFTADEVEAAWIEADGATRLELPLLVPEEAVEKTPTDRPMRIWIRLVDSRGRKTLRSIEASFTGEPFGVVYEAPPIAARPRRLPPVGSGELASNAATEAEEQSWRRATPGRDAKTIHDSGVTPAAFEAPAEEKSDRDAAEWRGAAAR